MAARTVNNMFRKAREEDETLTSRDLAKWLAKSDMITNSDLKNLSRKSKKDAGKLIAEEDDGTYLIGISSGGSG